MEQCSPYKTEDFALPQGFVEHPVKTAELADVEAIDLHLPYAAGINGGPFRTLRLTAEEHTLALHDFSAMPGDHREVLVRRDADNSQVPRYDFALEPGEERIFGRAEQHNPGRLPLLERSVVSREHFALSLSLDGLALTVRSLRSHNGMGIHVHAAYQDNYAGMFAGGRQR